MNKIIQGDALRVLQGLPTESVDMLLTSPPYWALRDYSAEGQLGLEENFEEYINNLCTILDEARRVLKKEGTCWINIDDTYAGSGKGIWNGANAKTPMESFKFKQMPKIKEGVPDKSLCMIPFRFAIEMVNRGWLLRNNIIWHKPNAMPESVKDRFTNDYEYLFFFTKSKKYYFEPQLEKSIWADRDNRSINGASSGGKATTGNYAINKGGAYRKDGLRNKRAIWAINTKPFTDAHFAVYPEELCRLPIMAGCPEGGVVLDPFFGSGTTGLVAKKLGRKYIGIELNPDYIKIAEKRLQQLELFS